MNKTNETSEILASLREYVERQEKLIEEKNQALLEQGRKEFEGAIAERKELFGKPESQPVIKESKIGPGLRSIVNNTLLVARRTGQRIMGVLCRKRID